MNKKNKIIILTLLSLIIISTITTSTATTYTITDSNYNTYFNNNSDLTSNVHNGDVLDLSGEIRNKNFNINKNLTFTSTQRNAQLLNCTIRLGSGASGSTISNLKINNSNDGGYGLYLGGSSYVLIENNSIRVNGSNAMGLVLDQGSNFNIVNHNTVITTKTSLPAYEGDWPTRTHSALVMGSSHNNMISNNYVLSDGANGIYFSQVGSSDGVFHGGLCDNNIVMNNTVIGAATGWSYTIQLQGNNNTVIANNVSGGNRGISGAGTYRVINNTVNAVDSGYERGIGIFGGSEIIGNIIIVSGDSVGIKATVSPATSLIQGNIIVANKTGIQVNMITTVGTMINGNNITVNDTYCIDTDDSTGLSIVNNYLKGVNVGDASVSSVSGNIVRDNYGSSVPLVADFSMSVDGGYSPLDVSFSDNSSGVISSWGWDFNNDGVIDSTLRNPTWTFNENGTYTVTLKITGPTGNDTVSKTISIQTGITNTLPEGTYTKNQKITLNTNTPGKIYYTLDNTNPNNTSTQYTQPLTISKTTTIKYIAYFNNGNTTPVYTKTYTINKPRVTINISPTTITTKGKSTITVTLKNGKTTTNGKITLKINKKTYTKNTKNGKATFYITGLKTSKYNIYTSVGETETYLANTNNKIKATKKADLYISKARRSGTRYYYITIRNKGSLASTTTYLKLYYKKGKKTYSKTVRVSSIKIGKTRTVRIKFYKYSTHKRYTKTAWINYNKKIIESTYTNNYKRMK